MSKGAPRKLLDLNDPFFAPAWIRVAIVAVCTCWGLFEFWGNSPLWGIIFLGLGVICAWRFSTIDYSPGDSDEGDG